MQLMVRKIWQMVVQERAMETLQLVRRSFLQMAAKMVRAMERLEDCMHPQRIRPGVVPRSATLAALKTLG